MLVLTLACIGLLLSLSSPAGATTAHSWGFECSSTYGWVRANWPTITTNSARRQPVYFRAKLDRWTGAEWIYVGATRWYVGVSDKYRRYQLDSSLGALPYPFVGELGHLFGYVSGDGTYAGPQLGPWFGNLPEAYYRTREQYSVNGSTFNSNPTHVTGTSETYCWA